MINLRAVKASHKAFASRRPGIGSWDSLPQWRKDYAVHLCNKGAEEAHNAWMLEKVGEGWSWDREINEGAKLHPWIAPFNQMQPADRALAEEFHALALESGAK